MEKEREGRGEGAGQGWEEGGEERKGEYKAKADLRVAGYTKCRTSEGSPGFPEGVTVSLGNSTRACNILGLDASHLKVSLHPLQGQRARRKAASVQQVAAVPRGTALPGTPWMGLPSESPARHSHSQVVSQWTERRGGGGGSSRFTALLTLAQCIEYTSMDFSLGMRKMRSSKRLIPMEGCSQPPFLFTFKNASGRL